MESLICSTLVDEYHIDEYKYCNTIFSELNDAYLYYLFASVYWLSVHALGKMYSVFLSTSRACHSKSLHLLNGKVAMCINNTWYLSQGHLSLSLKEVFVVFFQGY